MNPVQSYIFDKPKNQQAILNRLDSLINSHPKVTSKIRFRVPFYYLKTWFCYLNPKKDGAIELVFIRANEMSNENGLLEFRGRKQVAGVYLYDLADLNSMEESIKECLNEAFILDENVPYKGPRKND